MRSSPAAAIADRAAAERDRGESFGRRCPRIAATCRSSTWTN